MLSSVRISWGGVAVQAILAGIVAGTIIDCYLWLTTLLPAHQSIGSLWQWVASAAIGKVALTSPRYAAVGLAVHAVVSIGWAGAYAYLAAKQPVLDERWFVSGIVYGVVVYVIMQCVLLAGNSFTMPPNPNAFINVVLAHTVFFGLPVAFVVRFLQLPTHR